MEANNDKRIKQIIQKFNIMFTKNNNPNVRKGGLIGIAAVTIGLS